MATMTINATKATTIAHFPNKKGNCAGKLATKSQKQKDSTRMAAVGQILVVAQPSIQTSMFWVFSLKRFFYFKCQICWFGWPIL